MRKIFMDFDGTIVNARKAYCDVYSKLYSGCEFYEHPNWQNVTEWDLSKMCPLSREDLFGHDGFFYELEFMDNAKEKLALLSKEFDIIICTIGTCDNLTKKSQWIKYNLPFIKKSICINNGNNHMDKSIIDMRGEIIVDDVSNNLGKSNADIKLCFGDVFKWNEDWTGLRFYDWDSLYNELMKHTEERT
jgi:5'(3')-deoxyribonucleotidase